MTFLVSSTSPLVTFSIQDLMDHQGCSQWVLTVALCAHSPFAAKLGIVRDAGPGAAGAAELSRNTSLRAYGAIRQVEEPPDLSRPVLWSPAKELAEARERMTWHEAMSRRNIESSEVLQERRVIEYVAVGDFQTAVGFLLASTPEKSIRYYRDALCTLALAVRLFWILP